MIDHFASAKSSACLLAAAQIRQVPKSDFGSCGCLHASLAWWLHRSQRLLDSFVARGLHGLLLRSALGRGLLLDRSVGLLRGPLRNVLGRGLVLDRGALGCGLVLDRGAFDRVALDRALRSALCQLDLL